MQRQIVLTSDGSHTVSIPGMNVTYHSVHGAIQESKHVFINAGLHYASGRFTLPGTLNILELGLGTGLNALLTFEEAEKTKQLIHYTAVELDPLSEQEALLLNYCNQLNRADLVPAFLSIHQCEWERPIGITPRFILYKTNRSLRDYSAASRFHVIYFDAFAPAAQPELWTSEVFRKLHAMLLPGGILVTYCSKGNVRRAMQAAGFSIEKLQGPPGKREMLRAKKNAE